MWGSQHLGPVRNRQLMWLRVTCPNGHPLENERLRQAALSKRCPECQATVSLWTKVTCPNGHVLKVRTKHGGSRGSCPECKAAVTIPEFDLEQFLDVLLPTGPPKPFQPPQQAAESPKPVRPAAALRKTDYYTRMVKPDIETNPLTCRECRTVLFPGSTVCSNCGVPVE